MEPDLNYTLYSISSTDLKDIAILGFDCTTQNIMMSSSRGFPSFGILPREFRTAFDVSKKEGNCASWNTQSCVRLVFTNINLL